MAMAEAEEVPWKRRRWRRVVGWTALAAVVLPVLILVAVLLSLRAEGVRDLRAAGPDNGTVEFEAGGRTRRLRARLEERDARKLVEKLRRHLYG